MKSRLSSKSRDGGAEAITTKCSRNCCQVWTKKKNWHMVSHFRKAVYVNLLKFRHATSVFNRNSHQNRREHCRNNKTDLHWYHPWRISRSSALVGPPNWSRSRGVWAEATGKTDRNKECCGNFWLHFLKLLKCLDSARSTSADPSGKRRAKVWWKNWGLFYL
jgi:hypothetical protein